MEAGRRSRAVCPCTQRRVLRRRKEDSLLGRVRRIVYLSVLKPTPEREFPAVNLMNFAIYLGALSSFDFFIRQLLGYRREHAAKASFEEPVRLPDWVLLAVGYTIFIWSSLNLIGVSVATPHMTVAALVYLATGLLLGIHLHPGGWHSFVLLGIVLGFAYLARSPMFLLAFAFLGLAMLHIGCRVWSFGSWLAIIRGGEDGFRGAMSQSMQPYLPFLLRHSACMPRYI